MPRALEIVYLSQISYVALELTDTLDYLHNQRIS
jgi:hypothetical protein